MKKHDDLSLEVQDKRIAKVRWKLFTLALLVLSFWSISADGNALSKKFDFNVREASVRTLFETLAQKAGLQLELPQQVTGTISINFNDKTLDQAIQIIAKKTHLQASVVDGVLRVKLDDGKVAVAQETIDRTPAATPVGDTKATVGSVVATPVTQTPLPSNGVTVSGNVRVVKLNYVKAGDLASKLGELFGKDARIVADENTNSLMIVPLEGNINRILDLVASYDKLPRQILIEAQIIESSSHFAREMGVSFGTLSTSGSGMTGKNSISIRNAVPNPASVTAGFHFGSIDHQLLEARVSAAESNGEAKTISRPKVVTADRKVAVIESGISYHIKTLSSVSTGGSASGSGGSSSTASGNVAGGLTEVNAGLNLRVTPEIAEGDLIHLDIDISSSEAEQGSSVDGIPGVVKSSAKTALIVKEGVTATIGGIVKYSKSDSETGVPFFSRIPLLGWLFESSSKRDNNSELMIFITPHLLSDPRIQQEDASM